SFQSSAAASALAAIDACAAAATRNDDGNTGSLPVSVTASSADGAPPADVQRSARMSRAAFMVNSSYTGKAGSLVLSIVARISIQEPRPLGVPNAFSSAASCEWPVSVA